jgi:hypothetical protein
MVGFAPQKLCQKLFGKTFAKQPLLIPFLSGTKKMGFGFAN